MVIFKIKRPKLLLPDMKNTKLTGFDVLYVGGTYTGIRIYTSAETQNTSKTIYPN